jgi:hypothetical protein
MKKMIFAVAVALIFAVGGFAYAHGPGYGGSGGGDMMGQGYGGHMQGQGYGGHMQGQGYGGNMMAREGARPEDNKKFLDESRDLRRDLHNKRFEYMELSRNSDTSNDDLIKLEKEIFGLEDKIKEKAPRIVMGRSGNNQHCW